MDTCTTITAESLISLLDLTEKMLLLDCRTFMEYNQGHIISAVNMWCSKLLNRRLQQNKLTVTEILRNTFHIDIDNPMYIIVYEDEADGPQCLSMDNCVRTVLEKLCDEYKCVYFLQGGFSSFQQRYPMMCSDTSRFRPLMKSYSQPNLSTFQHLSATRILPFLWLGSEDDAADFEFITSHNITYIVNVSNSIQKSEYIQESRFLRVPVNDGFVDKLLPHFHNAFDFLDKVYQSGGNVLVHCRAGISRSATLVIGYVMERLHMSAEEAFRYVKSKRVSIAPNFNFLGQLQEHERCIRDQTIALHKVQTAPVITPETQVFNYSLDSARLAKMRSISTVTRVRWGISVDAT